MAKPFFTIGHSDRSLDVFLDMLRENEIERVADVRKLPGSRAHPHFNGDTLAQALAQAQIGYVHLPALGGLRGKSKPQASGLNDLWTNKSFRNYADYALTEPFREGLAELRALGGTRRVAIMCAEAVWWRCHRRIISDYLIAGGAAVFNIMGPGRIEPAKLTPGAVIEPDGSLIYPAPAASA